jgi:uncharacterized protein (TIGR03545 family)
LLAIAVTLLAIRYGVGIFLQSRLDRSSAAVGARAELILADVSPSAGRAEYGHLRVSDPLKPAQPWLTAKHCTLRFATGPLVREKMLVGGGEITGIHFARSAFPGGLSAVAGTPVAACEVSPVGDAARRADAWLARLDALLERGSPEHLESVRLTGELAARWPQRFAAVAQSVDECDERTAELSRRMEKAERNPLRHERLFVELPAELDAVAEEARSLASEIDRLPDTFDAERRAIVAARRGDEQRVRDELAIEPLDSGVWTEYLLRASVDTAVAEVVDCLRRMRHFVPAGSPMLQSVGLTASSGDSAAALGTVGVSLHAMALHGYCDAGGKAIKVRGTLCDFTTAPSCPDRPTRLHLTSVDSPALELSATLDRTGPIARDELRIEAQELGVAPLKLGGAEGLLLAVESSSATFGVDVTLRGEQLSGELQFAQEGLRLTPVLAAGIDDPYFAAALAESLANVKLAATRVILSGTIEEPRITIGSSIGPATAVAVSRAAVKAADERARARLVEGRRRVDVDLAQLDRMIAEGQALLRPRLAACSDQRERLAAQHAPVKRLDALRIGRRLPEGSLFR